MGNMITQVRKQGKQVLIYHFCRGRVGCSREGANSVHFNCLVRWKVTGGELFAQHLITTFGIYNVIS